MRPAAGGTIALAMLVCACVFAALAGPAVSLRLRDRGLAAGPEPGGLPARPSRSARAGTRRWRWTTAGQRVLTEDNLSSATTQIGGGLAQSVPILPGSWDGLTTNLHDVTSGMSACRPGYQPEFEVIYRDQLAGHVQTVGRVAGAANPHGGIEVTVTQQTAARSVPIRM